MLTPHGQELPSYVPNIVRSANFPPSIVTWTPSLPISTRFVVLSRNISLHKAHKIVQWGLVNFDACCLWVRHRTHLTDALDVTPEFLRSKHGDAGAFLLLTCISRVDLAV